MQSSRAAEHDRRLFRHRPSGFAKEQVGIPAGAPGGRCRATLRRRCADLARISHQLSAAASDSGMPTALRSVGRLDVLSSTPAAPSRRASCIHARLRRLATKPGEKSGLGSKATLPFDPGPSLPLKLASEASQVHGHARIRRPGGEPAGNAGCGRTRDLFRAPTRARAGRPAARISRNAVPRANPFRLVATWM